jgi:deoxycytidylate deaminase
VFYYQKKVVTGYNTLDTRVGGTCCYSTHAEVRAILRCIKAIWGKKYDFRNLPRGASLKGATVYVCRTMRSKEKPPTHGTWFGASRPCLRCERMIKSLGITRVKYTDIIDEKQVMCSVTYND